MVHTNETPKKTDSPKVGVGEIDTRAPFQSVKDAVNLFGEAALSGEKPAIKKANPHSAERVLAKESGLHLAQTELNKIKEQLQNAEDTKAEALVELEKAKRAVEDLSLKLRILIESKEAAIRATGAAKEKAKQLEEANHGNLALVNGFHKEDSESAREEYTNILSELNAAKQELARIRQDYELSLEAKATAMKQAEKAELAGRANVERATELSREIYIVKQTIEQVKLKSAHAQQEQVKIFAEKNIEKSSYKTRLEESAKKLQMMKQEFDPEVARNDESQLAEAMSKIEALKKEVENAKASDIDSVKTVTSELHEAKQSLQKVFEEENALQSSVDSLKQQLESLKKEHLELREKEAETESMAGNLHFKLQNCKSELEASLTEEAKARGALDEMVATLNQLATEAANAKLESEEMKVKAEELRKEAVATLISLEEAEQKLKTALLEDEEAKAAEAQALDTVKVLSEQADAARSSTSESGANITISRDEFEAISRKAEESEKLAEMKVAAANAQVEAVKASENETLKKVEAAKKEIEHMKAATEEALKKATMDEAAKKAVEGELRRWREREEKKAAEVASRILTEAREQEHAQAQEWIRTPIQTQVQTQTQTQTRLVQTDSGPNNYKFHSENQGTPERAHGGKKLDKQRTSMSKKVLMPSLSGMFHKKSSQVEGESLSYLPGEI